MLSFSMYELVPLTFTFRGDVHLAAIGQFYSNPKLGIPKDRDPRYMPNVISSAIVNTPPPEMMGDILNKRNKVHHLDHDVCFPRLFTMSLLILSYLDGRGHDSHVYS